MALLRRSYRVCTGQTALHLPARPLMVKHIKKGMVKMIKCNQIEMDGQSAIQITSEVTPQNIRRFRGLDFHLHLQGADAFSRSAYHNLVIRAIERHYFAPERYEERSELPDCLITRLLQRPSDETGWKLFRATIFADHLWLEYSYSENMSYQVLLDLGRDLTWLQCGIRDTDLRISEQRQAVITLSRELHPAPCSGMPGHGGAQLAHHKATVDLWHRTGNRSLTLDCERRYPSPYQRSQPVTSRAV